MADGYGLQRMKAQVRAFTLPFRNARAKNKMQPTLSNAVIAIVDDDASVRRGFERLIRSSGFQAEFFHSFDADAIRSTLIIGISPALICCATNCPRSTYDRAPAFERQTQSVRQKALEAPRGLRRNLAFLRGVMSPTASQGTTPHDSAQLNTIPATARESRRPAVRPSVAGGDFTTSKQLIIKSLWRRGELNPRPRKPVLKRLRAYPAHGF